MINNSKIPRSLLKQITSLKFKKNRDESGLYIAEGLKIVEEMLQYNEKIIQLIALERWISKNQALISKLKIDCLMASVSDLERASLLKTPQEVIAIAKKRFINPDWQQVPATVSLMLDNIQDPGNLGTIIRLADWFGIHHVFCTPGCADLYNPKTLQSTMGSFLRVSVTGINIKDFFKKSEIANSPVLGAFVDGHDIYKTLLPSKGIIVFGNESKGISNDVSKNISQRISIPSPVKTRHAESLNVSAAAAIVCSEFYRQHNV